MSGPERNSFKNNYLFENQSKRFIPHISAMAGQGQGQNLGSETQFTFQRCLSRSALGAEVKNRRQDLNIICSTCVGILIIRLKAQPRKGALVWLLGNLQELGK